MDFKRYGRKLGWNPKVRYTVHDVNGRLVEFGTPNRTEAKRMALSHGDGHWIKDNINTYFYYIVRFDAIRKIRVGSIAHQNTP